MKIEIYPLHITMDVGVKKKRTYTRNNKNELYRSSINDLSDPFINLMVQKLFILDEYVESLKN